jgi:hypothetical protein
MANARVATYPAQTGLQGLVLAALVFALLTSAFTGNAGVQVLDSALTARLFALHQHGVPGESEYIHQHSAPAPFVHTHCHAAVNQPDPPAPAEVQAAASLSGALLCADVSAVITTPASLPHIPDGVALSPSSAMVDVPTQPPR